jgi:uncharacterized protein
VILVDTGPFVALFDPKDGQHDRCKAVLKTIRDPLTTTLPVLTEVFHLLSPESLGAVRLREFLLRGGASVWSMDRTALARAFALMERYADHPMDLADASLIAAAEALNLRRIFTLDRSDFSTYRILRGRRHEAVEILG